MATDDFFFSLEFSSQGVAADLLEALAAHVLDHVGSPGIPIPELTQALQTAVDQGTAAGRHRCDIQFRASGGKLDIVVSSNGGRIWQNSLPIS